MSLPVTGRQARGRWRTRDATPARIEVSEATVFEKRMLPDGSGKRCPTSQISLAIDAH